MMTEMQLQTLRSKKYFMWLKQAKGAMCLMPKFSPLNAPMTRLLLSVDYQKLYDYLFFEIHYYLTRACFYKLLLRFDSEVDRKILRTEFNTARNKILSLLASNKGIEEEEDFKEALDDAFYTALADLHLKHKRTTHLLKGPAFTLQELLIPISKFS